MPKIDHFMVDYCDDAGAVHYANATPIGELTVAKALARKVSRKHGSAAAVAFEGDSPGPYIAIGHVMFSDGSVSDVDGVLA